MIKISFILKITKLLMVKDCQINLEIKVWGIAALDSINQIIWMQPLN